MRLAVAYGGVSGETAASGAMPLASRLKRVAGVIPCRRAIAETGMVSPNAVISRLLRLFNSCSPRGAQRQLLGEYGPLLSFRSIVWPSGFGPISSRKF